MIGLKYGRPYLSIPLPSLTFARLAPICSSNLLLMAQNRTSARQADPLSIAPKHLAKKLHRQISLLPFSHTTASHTTAPCPQQRRHSPGALGCFKAKFSLKKRLKAVSFLLAAYLNHAVARYKNHLDNIFLPNFLPHTQQPFVI